MLWQASHRILLRTYSPIEGGVGIVGERKNVANFILFLGASNLDICTVTYDDSRQSRPDRYTARRTSHLGKRVPKTVARLMHVTDPSLVRPVPSGRRPAVDGAELEITHVGPKWFVVSSCFLNEFRLSNCGRPWSPISSLSVYLPWLLFHPLRQCNRVLDFLLYKSRLSWPWVSFTSSKRA